MKICLVGPGIMPIPPTGWGAVESIIWECANELSELGHDGMILNTPDKNEIILTIKEEQFDFIHIHYDVFCDLIPKIKEVSPHTIIALSSHYPYINQFDKHRLDGYDKIFDWMISNSNSYYNFCVSDKDLEVFASKGVSKNQLHLFKTGSQHNGIKEILRNMLKIESNSEQHDLRNGDVYLKVYFQNSILYTLPVLCIDLYFFKELSFNTNEILKLKIKTDLLVFTKGSGNVEYIKVINKESVYECFNTPKPNSFDSFVFNQIVSEYSIPYKTREEIYSIQFGLVPIMKLDIRQLFDDPEYSVFKIHKNKIDERKSLFYQYL